MKFRKIIGFLDNYDIFLKCIINILHAIKSFLKALIKYLIFKKLFVFL